MQLFAFDAATPDTPGICKKHLRWPIGCFCDGLSILTRRTTCYNDRMSINPADIQLSPEQQSFVAAEAQRTGKAWSELLKQFVPDQPLIPSEENALEAADRLGLVGSCEGGPSDLATNPVHMEGFGQDALGSNAR